MEQVVKSTRGFAGMSLEKRRAIAAKGGASVPNDRRSFSQSQGLASKAGKKGGKSVPPDQRSFARSKELAKRAGAKGGKATHAKKRQQESE